MPNGLDTAALARQLAELDKVAIPLPHRLERYEHGGGRQWKSGPDSNRDLVADTFQEAERELFWLLRNNLPAILRALCVMAAVDRLRQPDAREDLLETEFSDGDDDHIYGASFSAIDECADEFLAECTGTKHD